MTPQQRRLLTAQLARRYGLDPRAVLSVAGVEGGFQGAVGDSGTSFGPFQLHWGGAMPSKYSGNRAASQRFANSRAGINYALRSMSKVARGLQGRAAVNAIVRRFERPADPDSEVARAMGLYGKTPAPGGGPGGPVSFGGGGGGGVSIGGGREMLLRTIMAQNAAFAAGQPIDPTAMTAMLLSSRIGQDIATRGSGQFGGGKGARGIMIGRGILGGKKWKDLGGPGAHSASGVHIWQNDRAVDVGAPVGTPVYAVRGGRIVGGFGESNSGPKIFGKRLTVGNKKNQFFYTHLGRYARGIRPGARVKRGQLLGFIGAMPGGPSHVHFASMRGDPYRFLR